MQKKEEAKAEHKQKSMAGILKKLKDQGDEVPAAFQGETGEGGDSDGNGDASDSDNDEEYYKQEVGENPDKEMFDKGSRDRKRKADSHLDSRMKKRLKKTEHHKKGGASAGQHPKFKAKKGKPEAARGKLGGKAGASAGKSNKRDGKAKKGPARAFNSQGVGPNFNKKKGSAPPVKKRAPKNRK